MAGYNYQKVNIVGDNYSRYGISVYDQLYNRSGQNGKASKTKAGHSSDYARNARTSRSGNTKVNDDKAQSTDSFMSDSATITTNGSRTSKIKNRYKSLLTKSSKKIINKLYDSYGNSDNFSVLSLKTTHSKHGHEIKNSPTFNDLPYEVLIRILSHIQDDQRTLVYCLYVSKRMYRASKVILYYNPYFTSTYRVAQFVTSLRSNPRNAKLVKHLNLSHLKNGTIEKSDNQSTQPLTSNQTSSHTMENHERSATSEFNEPLSVTRAVSEKLRMDISRVDLAWASWRDWAHRNEPPYYLGNIKSPLTRTNSISSSIHSWSSTSPSTLRGLVNPKRKRANSSVNSMTSSALFTLQDGSHLSLNSSISHQPKQSTPATSNTSIREIIDGETISVSPSTLPDSSPIKPREQLSLHSDDRNHSRRPLSYSKWFKTKIPTRRVKGKAHSSSATKLTTISSTSEVEITYCGKNEEINHREGPFSSKHPYASRFFVKYSLHADLPVGYILRMLTLCSNLITVDLSNVMLSPDYHIFDKSEEMQGNENKTFSKMVSCEMLTQRLPEVIFVSDSGKCYNTLYDKSTSRSRSSSLIPSNISSWLGNVPHSDSSAIHSLIDVNSRNDQDKDENRYELQKVSATEIFEALSSLPVTILRVVKLNQTTWCRQSMVKSLIFSKLKKLLDNDYELCDFNWNLYEYEFFGAGMDRNFPWACTGNLKEQTALIVIDEVIKYDDLILEEIFNIHSGSICPAFESDDILEYSNEFHIEFMYSMNELESLNFQLVIIQGCEPRTSLNISKISSNCVMMEIILAEEDLSNIYGFALKRDSESMARLKNSCIIILNKLRILRDAELQRNVGENYS